MKHLLWAVVFVQMMRSGDITYSKYEGYDKEQVYTLLMNLGCEDIKFINEKQYKDNLDRLKQKKSDVVVDNVVQ